MATIDLTDATVTISGVDLSSYASSVGFDLDPWQEQMLRRVEGLPNGTLPLFGFRWVSRGYAPPGVYEAVVALIGASRAARRRRIRRMHAAYGRRRGPGRW